MLPYFIGEEESMRLYPTTLTVTEPLPVASVAAFATLFEYISADEGERNGAGTQGAEKIRALIAAIPDHQSWDTLIPTLFGVSRRDFEAGWNAFLAERYGIAQ
jgi:hypothetical protein